MNIEHNRKLQGEVARFVARLGHLIRAMHMYEPGHASLDLAVRSLAGMSQDLLSKVGGAFTVSLTTGRVRVGETEIPPPPGMSDVVRELSDFLEARGVGGFTLSEALATEEALAFGTLLWQVEDDWTFEETRRRIAERGVRGLRLEAAHPEVDALDDELVGEASLVGLRLYLRGLRTMKRLDEQGLTPAVLLQLDRISRGLITLVDQAPRVALALVEPKQSLPYAYRHPVHMAVLSVILGHRLGMADELLLDLAICALLVDVGMRALPRELHEGGGTQGVRAREGHPVASVRELLDQPRLPPELRRRLIVAFEHHLGLDHSGYPEVQQWPALHPFSRIIAVADAWDSLRTPADQMPGATPEAASLGLQRAAGTYFDPAVVEQLVSLWPRRPARD